MNFTVSPPKRVFGVRRRPDHQEVGLLAAVVQQDAENLNLAAAQ